MTIDSTSPVPGNASTTEGVLDRSPGIGYTVSFFARPVLNVDNVVTQILENALVDLDNLRRSLERTNRKAIDDVRNHDFVAVLAGTEETISYDGLLDVIKELKDGVAMRRVQLLQESLAIEGAAA